MQFRRSKQERLDPAQLLIDENGGRLFWIAGGATRLARGQATLLSVVVPAARTVVLLVALVGEVLAGPLEDANEALIRKYSDPRPFSFIVRSRSQGIRRRKSISVTCLTRGLVYREITAKPSGDTALLPIKVSPRG